MWTIRAKGLAEGYVVFGDWDILFGDWGPVSDN